jgi:hypothetical protein
VTGFKLFSTMWTCYQNSLKTDFPLPIGKLKIYFPVDFLSLLYYIITLKRT